MDIDMQPDNPWDGRSLEERSDQLSAYGAVCRRLAAMLMIRGEVRAARLYTARALRAEELLAHGFAQGDLDALSDTFPAEPAWLAGTGDREPWQDEVVRVHGLAVAAGDTLRS